MSEESALFLATAIRAAGLAGKVILANLGDISKNDIGLKGASDFVTHVDRESEQIIINTIKKEFPHHSFLAEELMHETEAGKYRWIIDPLDGTTNYIHQYPVFSVSIALEYRKEIVLGVVYDPLRKEIFHAEKGEGAYLNKRKMRVSSVDAMKNSLIATGFPFRKRECIGPYLRLFKNVFIKVSDLRRAGSAALDLASLACGRCEGFFEIGLSPWDVAAGSLLIKEAGGIVTDFRGGAEYIKTGNIVAGAPVIHKALLKEVKKIFSETIPE